KIVSLCGFPGRETNQSWTFAKGSGLIAGMDQKRSSSRIAHIVPLLLLAVPLFAENVPPAFLFDRDVMIPMRDGTKLAANIFRPKAEGKYPVILMRTPYGKPDENWGDPKLYVPAGYVMVAQDCRGRGKSEGAWDPFRYDVEDGYDTQEWVGHQPWCNGEIGTAGGSYVGWTQWSAAPNSSRYLKAMVPVVPFGNAYDLAYAGGAFQLALLMGWGAGVGGVVVTPDQLSEAYLHLPLDTFGDQFEKKVGYLNDWIRHPEYDEYWKQRGMDYRYRDVTVPALNIGGWYDIFSKTTIELVNEVRASSRNREVRRNQFVIMGPWTHGVGTPKVGELDFGPESMLDLGQLQFKWFEYWLKGHDTGVQDWPALYLFVMGENRWRGENEWPLKRTRFTSYFLHGDGHANSASGDGGLSTEPPAAEKADGFTYDPQAPVPSLGGNNLVGATAGPYDQAKVESRQDVLVYTTTPLEHDLEVTGPVKLVLWAASDAQDTDFTGKLVDVSPSGKAYNLCEGILRARYRHDRGKPELLVPGQSESYDIDLWVTSNLFKHGHRIRVEVSSSNFPRFDRNPNTGHAFGTDSELVPAHQTVFHDRDHPSHLVLPIIPR
ncbi:MAG TPA: CocE/NonD family hydrolase, partial [Verrucomicrobiae bacterium]|nr:CocE/NonD family hydrolase [Verrucomicrobiae bacterium]